MKNWRPQIALTLNIGLIILLAGILSVNPQLIFTGGTLIFIATSLLARQLWGMCGVDAQPLGQSVKFYVTGLLYLLSGMIVGTGLWLGWSGPLRIQACSTHLPCCPSPGWCGACSGLAFGHWNKSSPQSRPLTVSRLTGLRVIDRFH